MIEESTRGASKANGQTARRLDEVEQLATGLALPPSLAKHQIIKCALSHSSFLLSISVALSAVAGATLDNAFAPQNFPTPYSIAVLANGDIISGGHAMARCSATGTGTTYVVDTAQLVSALAVLADGKILAAGDGISLGGGPKLIGRLNPDGTPDPEFQALVNGKEISCLAVQADGEVIIGGDFYEVAWQRRNNIARLSLNGQLDGTFDPGADNRVMAVALQSDRKVVVGGIFGALGGQAWPGIGRLDPAGAPDLEFMPSLNSEIRCVAVQADDRVLVGGRFISQNLETHTGIRRLNLNGTLDLGFRADAETTSMAPYIFSMVVQADGRILVGGDFTTLGGHARSGLGRLNPDGTVDTTFVADVGGTVYSLGLQADGKILLGGLFYSIAGQPCGSFGRLYNTEPATQRLSYNGSVITWLRGGTSPEVWRTTFEYSTNAVDWVSLGAGTRIVGGWQSTNVLLPPGSTVRSRGYTTGGYRNASSWFLESLLSIAAPAGVPLLSVETTLGPLIRFKVTGGTNAQHLIETSTNLMPSGANEWQPVTTLTLTNGSAIFDWTNAGETHRFFRAR